MTDRNAAQRSLRNAMAEGGIHSADLVEPDFENARLVHDWRNYVPEAVRAVWAGLDETGRIAVYLTAEARASAEEWE